MRIPLLRRLGSGGTMADTIVMSGSGLLVQALLVVSAALVARMLGVEERGHFAVLQVSAVIFSQVAFGGIRIAVTRTVARSGNSARGSLGRSLLLRWLWWSLLTGICAAVLSASMLWGVRWWPLYPLAALALTVWMVWQFVVGSMLAGEGDARRMASHQVVGSLLYVVLVVVVFVVAPVTSAAVLLLVILPVRAFSILFGWRLLRRPGDEDELIPAGVVHRFARRSQLGGMRTMSLGIDHLLVGALLGSVALGLYSVAALVTNLPTMVLGVLASIVLARVSAAAADRRRVILKWVVVALGLDAVLVVGLEAIIAPAIRIILGEEFVPSTPVARILIVAWALMALRLVLAAMLNGAGRPGRASLVEVVGTMLLVVASSAGALLGGVEGAAIGFGVAAACSCLALGVLLWQVTANDAGADDAGAEADERPLPGPAGTRAETH